jgi:hypothetical protein
VKNPSFIVVSDANGDKILTIGPFASPEAIYKYMDERTSKSPERGEWYLDGVFAEISPEDLDWKPGESVYEAMEKRRL